MQAYNARLLPWMWYHYLDVQSICRASSTCQMLNSAKLNPLAWLYSVVTIPDDFPLLTANPNNQLLLFYQQHITRIIHSDAEQFEMDYDTVLYGIEMPRLRNYPINDTMLVVHQLTRSERKQVAKHTGLPLAVVPLFRVDQELLDARVKCWPNLEGVKLGLESNSIVQLPIPVSLEGVLPAYVNLRELVLDFGLSNCSDTTLDTIMTAYPLLDLLDSFISIESLVRRQQATTTVYPLLESLAVNIITFRTNEQSEVETTEAVWDKLSKLAPNLLHLTITPHPRMDFKQTKYTLDGIQALERLESLTIAAQKMVCVGLPKLTNLTANFTCLRQLCVCIEDVVSTELPESCIEEVNRLTNLIQHTPELTSLCLLSGESWNAELQFLEEEDTDTVVQDLRKALVHLGKTVGALEKLEKLNLSFQPYSFGVDYCTVIMQAWATQAILQQWKLSELKLIIPYTYLEYLIPLLISEKHQSLTTCRLHIDIPMTREINTPPERTSWFRTQTRAQITTQYSCWDNNKKPKKGVKIVNLTAVVQWLSLVWPSIGFSELPQGADLWWDSMGRSVDLIEDECCCCERRYMSGIDVPDSLDEDDLFSEDEDEDEDDYYHSDEDEDDQSDSEQLTLVRANTFPPARVCRARVEELYL